MRDQNVLKRVLEKCSQRILKQMNNVPLHRVQIILSTIQRLNSPTLLAFILPACCKIERRRVAT